MKTGIQGGAILKKVSAVRERVEVLLFADTAHEFLSKQERIMRVGTRRGQRFTSRLFYTVYRNNAVKGGKNRCRGWRDQEADKEDAVYYASLHTVSA